ncbi:MAG TPA: PilC/PilY family type IV pilus protein [Steroidobacteraceae bacterium]|nr:PilC/PilY family type IV pilus protein [Steroidobacteraceae bacterium]
MNAHPHRLTRRALALALMAVLILVGVGSAPAPVRATATPTVSIAQYPLTVAVPAHPQVLIAVGNSESMDGDLSGAIMTGSGALADTHAAAGLANSSSPVNYQIPAGFTPPINAGSGGYAPYTVTTSGVQYDNSASRLNVAKAGITAILNDYMEYADFALEDYNTSGNALYTTWVYYMSQQSSNFTFSNTASANTVANPCYGANVLLTDSYDKACASLLAHYTIGYGSVEDQYLVTADTSDDPAVNDVFYAPNNYQPPVCVSGSPSVTSPYTTWNLGQYNVEFWGGYPIIEWYGTLWGSSGSSTTCDNNMVPTNAGYIPSSKQVYQAERGFGYGANQSATTGTLLVGMQSSGAVPTAASTAAAIAHFTPYLAAETNSVGTSEIKASAGQSPIYGVLATALSYFNGRPATNSSNGCAATRYVVLVTDGLPTLDHNNKAWPPLGTVPGNGYGVTVTFNSDGSLASTNDQALTDTIAELAALKSAGVKTYIIGLGAGVETAANPQAANTLTAMAVAGGTGSYFAATSPVDLTNDMQAILANILAETAATSASAINSTGISTTSVAYQGTFTTSDVYQDWTGNLLAYPINAATGYIDTTYTAALWQAQVELDTQNYASPGRLITTWDPVVSQGTAFEWSTNPTATSGIAASTALGQALETFSGDTNGQDVLNYLRGNSAKEQRNGGQFRNRAHKLGDIVDSSPLYVGAPSGPWQQSSYFSFENTYFNRQPMLYIGANDGMLHAINASTGHEVFAFIPHSVWSNLVNLASPYYNPQHRFYVDASPQAADIQFSDNTWHTVLLGAERGGGNSIFAIDVTDPSQFTSEDNIAQKVLWEFTDANMGDTFSEPVAVYTAAGFAVMFGNGYDSPTGKPYLYALNPQAGTVMAKIDLCAAVPTACNLSLPNGLSSITSMSTSGALLSGNPNVIYAGDLQGNLWRIDISNSNPADWTVSVLFQATDSSGNRQAITVTPQATMNPLAPRLEGAMVYFGTGQLLGLPDLSTTQVQSVYGVFDSGTAPATPYTRSSLVQQTITTQTATTSSGASTTIRLLSSNAVNLPASRGWYVDLNVTGSAGERVVTDPALFNGTLQITTYQPNSNTCVGGGNAYYMVFNYATGGATTLPQFDWYGSGTINSADLYDGQTVAGASLGNSYAAAPKMVTLGDQAIVYITTGAAQVDGQCNGTTCDKNELNADPSARGAWEEIK